MLSLFVMEKERLFPAFVFVRPLAVVGRPPPSIGSRPYCMDATARLSLARYLGERGHRCLLDHCRVPAFSLGHPMLRPFRPSRRRTDGRDYSGWRSFSSCAVIVVRKSGMDAKRRRKKAWFRGWGPHPCVRHPDRRAEGGGGVVIAAVVDPCGR